MPSAQHEMVVQMLSAQPRNPAATIAETRAGFEQLAQLFPLAADVRAEPVSAGGVPAEWVSVSQSRIDRVVLYLHGGGYVIGSPNSHRELASRVARATQARALVPDYRLAPEHPFPAAVEDAVASYRWLLGAGILPAHIAIAGDSAGGGLTLATLTALRDEKLPLPAAGVCLSPWVDLELTGASAQPDGADDPLRDFADLHGMGKLYAAGNMRHPQAAPLYADYHGLPPLLILVGTREVLLDDATRVAARAKAAGVDVTLEPWVGLIHVWPLFGPDMPEGQQAVARIGEFVRQHTG
jgi:monoterpene epsilon-lactone hydrolase